MLCSPMRVDKVKVLDIYAVLYSKWVLYLYHKDMFGKKIDIVRNETFL